MRRIVWMTLGKPAEVESKNYKSLALELASAINGELVSVLESEDAYAIIGDSRSAELLKAIRDRADKLKHTITTIETS